MVHVAVRSSASVKRTRIGRLSRLNHGLFTGLSPYLRSSSLRPIFGSAYFNGKSNTSACGFQTSLPFSPAGDQPQAIEGLTRGLLEGKPAQTLLGATGTGKTFTVANVIAQVQRPALVLSHNKTLAAQLYAEFREFFPENAVHYFVSYYDYYQPEAYIPQRDIYIEKDASINEEIDRFDSPPPAVW